MKHEISYGEFYDKFTILVNKIYNCRNPMDVLNAMFQLMDLSKCFENTTVNANEETMARTIRDLRDANKALWDLEALVRIEEDDKRRLELSDQIRDWNWSRATAKNKIDFITKSNMEIKDYGTPT